MSQKKKNILSFISDININELTKKSKQGFLKDLENKPFKNYDGRSIKQYESIKNLYEAFGVSCPPNPQELQADIRRRYTNWKIKTMRDEI